LKTLIQVGVKVEIGQDPSCNETLRDTALSFADGWQDWSFDLTQYAGENVYIKVESYAVDWNSSLPAVDYFYIKDSLGRVVSPDPYFDNGWVDVVGDLKGDGANPYLVVDFGGFEENIKGFIDYFHQCFDGFHIYNPVHFAKIQILIDYIQRYFNETSSQDLATLTNGTLVDILNRYSNALDFAHSYNKTFIATVVPGFNDLVDTLWNVDRQNGTIYNLFWQSAIASHPDGYVVTSFNEWGEATEIEPSREYGYQYIDFTPLPLPTTPPASTQPTPQITTAPVATNAPSDSGWLTIVEVILLVVALTVLSGGTVLLWKRRGNKIGKMNVGN
jgi:hypothetical protein